MTIIIFDLPWLISIYKSCINLSITEATPHMNGPVSHILPKRLSLLLEKVIAKLSLCILSLPYSHTKHTHIDLCKLINWLFFWTSNFIFVKICNNCLCSKFTSCSPNLLVLLHNKTEQSKKNSCHSQRYFQKKKLRNCPFSSLVQICCTSVNLVKTASSRPQSNSLVYQIYLPFFLLLPQGVQPYLSKYSKTWLRPEWFTFSSLPKSIWGICFGQGSLIWSPISSEADFTLGLKTAFHNRV